MSTKRRDNKGRVLLNGEIQEESGRYRYRYIDILGKRREIYCWRLTEADPTPAGRRRDKSLREKEEAAMLLQFKGISGSDMTVLDLVERYITLLFIVCNGTSNLRILWTYNQGFGFQE